MELPYRIVGYPLPIKRWLNLMSPNNTVIYVDDDEDDRDIFTEVIRAVRPDLRLILAKDGTDALVQLQALGNPVCMYIDMNMPKMNGMQLLAALKSQPQFKTIPAFILTTALTPNQTIELKSLGASDYLIKPSSFDDFKALLRTSLDRFIQ